MRIHIILHESFEAPGAIADWAALNRLAVTYTRLYLGETFPVSFDCFDYLIVMGGPQSPSTSMLECPHFNAEAEISFIRKAILCDKFVLGVCLGAQMIGEALGAKFEHSPNREIGVFDISLTKEGKEDAIFRTFPDNFLVGHWHGDMPGLTRESKVLATSEGCPRQIVFYSPKVYGFQCHFEFTAEAIEGMIKNCGQELEDFYSLPYIQTAQQLRENNYLQMNQLLFSFLDQMKLDFESYPLENL